MPSSEALLQAAFEAVPDEPVPVVPAAATETSRWTYGTGVGVGVGGVFTGNSQPHSTYPWLDRGAGPVERTFFDPWQESTGVSDVYLPGCPATSTLPHRVVMIEPLSSYPAGPLPNGLAHEYVFRAVPMAVQVPQGRISWRSWEPVERGVEVYRYGYVHQLLQRIAQATNILRFQLGITGDLRMLVEALDGIDVEARAWLAV